MTEKLAKKLDKKPAKKVAAKAAPTDRDELVSSMEPMLISTESRHRARLNELVFELNTAATQFRTSLPEGMVGAICDVVRSMNCYYSNLIEGHNTHPVDIERALAGDYSQDTEKRNLQKEPKRTSPHSAGSMKVRWPARRPQCKRCSTSTSALKALCLPTCFGLRSRAPDAMSRSSPANYATAMSGSASISRSARARYRAFSSAGRERMPGSANPRRFSRPPLPITVCQADSRFNPTPINSIGLARMYPRQFDKNIPRRTSAAAGCLR